MKTKNNKIDTEAVKTANLRAFVQEPCTMEQLKASKAYILWEKSIDTPSKLTRAEKDWLAREFASNVFNRKQNVIHLGGWELTFPTAKHYLVQDEPGSRTWREYKAFDKTSLREALYGIGKIMDFPNEK